MKMLSIKPAISVALLLATALFLQACLESPFGPGSNENQSRVRVLVTDEPADNVVEAWVTIHRVELIDVDGEVTLLSDEDHYFDLLTLQDGETLLLADALVDQGTYKEIRIVVDQEASVLLNTGETMTLKVPSGSTSGIKVKFAPFTIDDETDEFELVADFDFGRSFVKAGNSGKVIFKPVIHAKSLKQDGEFVILSDDDIEDE